MDGENDHQNNHYNYPPFQQEPEYNANRPPQMNQTVVGRSSGTSTQVGSNDDPADSNMDLSETARRSSHGFAVLGRDNDPNELDWRMYQLRISRAIGPGSSEHVHVAIPLAVPNVEPSQVYFPPLNERQHEFWGIGGFAENSDTTHDHGPFQIEGIEDDEGELKHAEHDVDDDETMTFAMTI